MLGIFEGQTVLGATAEANFHFNKDLQSYHFEVAKKAGIHFLWKKVSGDFFLDMRLPKQQGKSSFGLMVRKDLKENAPFFLLESSNNSLIFVDSIGENTAKSPVLLEMPKRQPPEYFRLEKRKNQLLAYAADAGKGMKRIYGNTLKKRDEWYLGIFVKSPVSTDLRFDNVRLTQPASGDENEVAKERVVSRLEVLDIETGLRQIVHEEQRHFEAPNWYRDGSYFILNSDGLLFKVPVKGGAWQQIDTDKAENCNNDHGFSPDGKSLVISNNDAPGSRIYTLPIEGGKRTQITLNAPSYWHGWSPDGKTLAFVGKRNDDFNIFLIPTGGIGEETQITDAVGLDDGPDYSPDGKFIYFNSVRTGTMQIWRMKPDGDEQTQLTFDACNDWFAHPSPDGRWLIFVSFLPEVPAGSHPPNKRVMLRLLSLQKENAEPLVVAHLYGGQGTINVPSWSPDSKKVAFVSYSYPTSQY